MWEWWDLFLILCYKFIAELAMKNVKISRHLAKLSVRKLIASSARHYPTER